MRQRCFAVVVAKIPAGTPKMLAARRKDPSAPPGTSCAHDAARGRVGSRLGTLLRRSFWVRDCGVPLGRAIQARRASQARLARRARKGKCPSGGSSSRPLAKFARPGANLHWGHAASPNCGRRCPRLWPRTPCQSGVPRRKKPRKVVAASKVLAALQTVMAACRGVKDPGRAREEQRAASEPSCRAVRVSCRAPRRREREAPWILVAWWRQKFAALQGVIAACRGVKAPARKRERERERESDV